jgi:hypothetical protein
MARVVSEADSLGANVRFIPFVLASLDLDTPDTPELLQECEPPGWNYPKPVAVAASKKIGAFDFSELLSATPERKRLVPAGYVERVEDL